MSEHVCNLNNNSYYVYLRMKEIFLQGKEAEAVYGQQDIHQKKMQLNFRDCHAKIRQV